MRFNRGTGNGKGFGNGNGSGKGRRNAGLGPEGKCVCPECGTEIAHQRGIPCYEQTCPECGSKLTRKELAANNKFSKNNVKRNTNGSPNIDTEKCTGCGQCVNSCPFGAITLRNGKAAIDDNLCRGCNQCIRSCPVRAITP